MKPIKVIYEPDTISIQTMMDILFKRKKFPMENGVLTITHIKSNEIFSLFLDETNKDEHDIYLLDDNNYATHYFSFDENELFSFFKNIINGSDLIFKDLKIMERNFVNE